jgi:hypothetical protein
LPLLFISYVKKNPNARIQKQINISIVPQEYKEYMEYWKKDYDIDIPPDGHWNIYGAPHSLDSYFLNLRWIV